MRLGRVVAWAVLVASVLVAVWAWARVAPEGVDVTQPNEYLERTDWWGALAPDGTLAVEVHYSFTDTARREWSAEPENASFTVPAGAVRVRVDGRPRIVDSSDSVGSIDLDGAPLVLAYDLPGAGRTGAGGGLVSAAMLPSNWSPFGFGNAEVRGALTVMEGSTPTRLALPPLRDVRARSSAGQVRFSGVQSTTDDVHLLALVPAAAVPDAPPVAGTADIAYGLVLDQVAGGPRSDGMPGRRTRVGRVVFAVIATLWAALLVGLAVQARRRARRRVGPEPTGRY